MSKAGTPHPFVPLADSPFCADCGWLRVHPNHVGDREPQPSDGPDYHADHQAWVARQ